METNYQKICANLLEGTSLKTKEVLERRFGLKTGKRETLEAIGKDHGVTRERVRQIEEAGFSAIRPKIKQYQNIFRQFRQTLSSSGGVRKEAEMLAHFGGEKFQNQVSFLLALDPETERFSEDREFFALLAKNSDAANSAKKLVRTVSVDMDSYKKLISLDELFQLQKEKYGKIISRPLNKKILGSFLDISKNIQKNPEGKYGLAHWLEINPKGVKDRAYLAFKKAGRPLHFTEVATNIEKLPFPLQGKAHVATVHNELIKDSRFVLVGRGVYALKEWGYEPGTVKDVILDILKKENKPVSKDEIVNKVLSQRIVKKNTIFLNLQDRNLFNRGNDGRYSVNPVQEA